MDLVIVSSAINTYSAPLSYYPIRSVFPKEERFQQTFKTLESIKKIPNKKVSFVECTEIPQEYEDEIKSRDFIRWNPMFDRRRVIEDTYLFMKDIKNPEIIEYLT
ncbi:MAG: hypothetical protein BWY21_01549 [Parcubacteria group bacterium ADurb.Bin216]|nr:MAG: hypothetical protein BWY21_01549 [Parcubacteria group bacterium ADurb.Bin216]